MKKFVVLVLLSLASYKVNAQIEAVSAMNELRLTLVNNQSLSFDELDKLKTVDYNTIKEVVIQARPGTNEALDKAYFTILLNEMPQLEKLYISYNIVDFPEIPHPNTALKTLELPYNKLNTLPESIANLKQLETLSLLNNPHFNQLPSSLKSLKNLKYLALLTTAFQEFPLVVFEIPSLETLLISGQYHGDESSRIQVIPNEFDRLPQLKVLNISNTAFTSLPSSMEHLKNLNELYLDGNKMRVFPDLVKRFSKLVVFGMSNNPLDFEAYKQSIKGIKWRGLLYLADVGFTESQYEELQRLLPKHDLYY